MLTIAFLYQMPTMDNWVMDLYGKGFEPERNTRDSVRYHGFIQADDFIAQVETDFGLVWDGDSPDTCVGAWGEYLRINDPHKTSFYLKAGIPVIVWSQAAMAPFIQEEGVGIAVNSIGEINEALACLTADDYKRMKERALLMGQRLAEGHYIKSGLRAAFDHLSDGKQVF